MTKTVTKKYIRHFKMRSFTLDNETFEQLGILADASHMKQSAWLRQIVRRVYEAHEKKEDLEMEKLLQLVA
jgi:hypothetical protein